MLLSSFDLFDHGIQKNLTRAFKTYVRPLLEYASSVWSPSHVMLINSLESVQRRFTKRLTGMDQLSYAERLDSLKLQSLEQRRLITDLTTCYNIIQGHTSLSSTDFFTLNHNTSLRGHPHRIVIPLTTTDLHKHFFSCRIIVPWNSLPSPVVIAKTIGSFKSQLNKINLQKYITQLWILI